jgi:hypothetical protein
MSEGYERTQLILPKPIQHDPLTKLICLAAHHNRHPMLLRHHRHQRRPCAGEHRTIRVERVRPKEDRCHFCYEGREGGEEGVCTGDWAVGWGGGGGEGAEKSFAFKEGAGIDDYDGETFIFLVGAEEDFFHY